MNERIREFLIAENKSSAQLAEEIGVQPSGISHILSGRNNPSLDFILKMLEKYNFLSTDWLLFGKGSMYKDPKIQSLFDENSVESEEPASYERKRGLAEPGSESEGFQTSGLKKRTAQHDKDIGAEVVKIVWFYDNNSFEEYNPSR